MSAILAPACAWLRPVRLGPDTWSTEAMLRLPPSSCSEEVKYPSSLLLYAEGLCVPEISCSTCMCSCRTQRSAIMGAAACKPSEPDRAIAACSCLSSTCSGSRASCTPEGSWLLTSGLRPLSAALLGLPCLPPLCRMCLTARLAGRVCTAAEPAECSCWDVCLLFTT